MFFKKKKKINFSRDYNSKKKITLSKIYRDKIIKFLNKNNRYYYYVNSKSKYIFKEDESEHNSVIIDQLCAK